MFDSVTGGIARVVGGLWALDAGVEMCGRSTIGGCNNVQIAFQILAYTLNIYERTSVYHSAVFPT